jgi:hypothetical protein
MQGLLAQAGKRHSGLQDRQLRMRLTVEGNTQGLATLDELQKLQNARSSLNELNLKSSLIEEQLSVAESRVAAQRQSGATTELESLAQLSAARSRAVVQLTEIADQMAAVAQASGDTRMLANVEAFKARIEQLAASTDLLGTKFRLIFEDNLTTFFTDLISGAKSFKGAFLDMARGIEQAITRIVAQNLAQSLAKSLFESTGVFGGNFGGGFTGFVGSIFSGLFGSGSGTTPATGSLPGRATGGDVHSNQAYWVGERGPEVFVPKSAGFIVPNDRLTRSPMAGAAAAGSNAPGMLDRLGLPRLLEFAAMARTTSLHPAALGWALPARAAGGPVAANQAYLVGERGPEVFMSASMASAGSASRASHNSIVIHNTFAAGTDLRTIDQAATQIGLRVQRALRRN